MITNIKKLNQALDSDMESYLHLVALNIHQLKAIQENYLKSLHRQWFLEQSRELEASLNTVRENLQYIDEHIKEKG